MEYTPYGDVIHASIGQLCASVEPVAGVHGVRVGVVALADENAALPCPSPLPRASRSL